MRVVFHADDFGLSPAINAGIIEAYERGLLRSTSLIATGAGARDAVERARRAPGLDVGLHVTLVEERPALPPDEIPHLLAGGRFLSSAGTVMRRWCMGRWSAAQAAQELEAQWTWLEAQGLRASHVDGHQHLHVLPDVFPSVIAAARRRGVRFVRHWFPEPRGHAPLGRWASLWAIRAVTALAWHRLPRADRAFLTPFVTVGFMAAGGTLRLEELLAMLDALRVAPLFHTGTPDLIVEVMLHPGHRDRVTTQRYAHWHYCWEHDLALLVDPRLRSELDARGITVTSFRELADAAVA